MLHFRCYLVMVWRAAALFLSIYATAVHIPHRTCHFPSSHGQPFDCFAQKCWCTDHVANCSRNNNSLLFVPVLPPTIQALDRSFNNLESISDNFFANVTNIRFLKMCYTHLVYISREAFVFLKRLEVLIMTNNSKLKTVESVFGGQALKCVDLAYGALQSIPHMLNKTLALEKLYAFSNVIESLNFLMGEPFPNLRQMDCSHNHLNDVIPGYMGNLKILLLGNNNLQSFPESCSFGDSSFFPRLTMLDLNRNTIHVITSRICLPELRHLRLDRNTFLTIQSSQFSVTRFPNLTILESNHVQVQKIENYAFRNPHLQNISLMSNNINFSQGDSVQLNSFVGCSNLRSLHIGGNIFLGLSDERFDSLFGHLTNLQEIFMQKCFLQTITVRTFAKFPQLKTLHLQLNEVAYLPDGVFARNPCLESLNLNGNSITTITRKTFTEETRGHLKSLDLSENPFVCDCDLQWFREWLVRDKTLFHTADRRYNCSNLPVQVALFSMPDQPCMLSRSQNELIIATVSFMLLASVLFAFLFRFRWHIRLMLYEAFRGNCEARWRRLEAGRFNYDVFVSYAENDSQWVLDHLVPELEGRMGLSLCVHTRDFIPGKTIVDNITDCVEQSKKILMVFSADFVRSQWCQFELTFCLHHVIENDDALLVVCLGDVTTCHLTSAMMAVLKTTVYIQWADDNADALASFWGRLKIALREVIPIDQS